jgi:hypothetical protein
MTRQMLVAFDVNPRLGRHTPRRPMHATDGAEAHTVTA